MVARLETGVSLNIVFFQALAERTATFLVSEAFGILAVIPAQLWESA